MDRSEARSADTKGTIMAHTYTQILVHMVFATKERRPLIMPQLKTDLHAYMAGISRNLGCHVYALGGVPDHCHLVFDLSPTIALADFANKVKAGSTKWARRERGRRNFGWQRGYGAFSVSQQNLERAIQYVESQEAHHRKRSFQEELEAFMTLHGMVADNEFIEGVFSKPDMRE